MTMPFQLLAPTGSVQYSFPVQYVFESLYGQLPTTEITPERIGQLWPSGKAMGLGQV